MKKTVKTKKEVEKWISAIVTRDINTLKNMIKSGFDVNFNYNGDWSALREMCYHGEREIAKLLIDNGADVNAQDSDGRTVFHNTVKYDDKETTLLLLENGADINKQDNDGWTALHEAGYRGYTDLIKLLLDNGADIEIEDIDGRTPFHWACWAYKEEGKLETLKLLINNNANLNKKDRLKTSALREYKENHLQEYEELIQWLAEEHPEKLLEYMASESVQGNGIGL